MTGPEAETDLLAAYPYLLPRAATAEPVPEPERPFDYEAAASEEPASAPGPRPDPSFDQVLDDAFGLVGGASSASRSRNVSRGAIRDLDEGLGRDGEPAVPPPAHPAQELGWPQARAVAARAGARPLGTQERDAAEALGAVLAAPLAAATHLPAFDTSAMDGWSVAGPGPWRLRTPAEGEGLAGRPAADALRDGEAVRIATGAPLPSGATAVLRREDGVVCADGTELACRPGIAVPPPGRDIRPRGQECRSGDALLPAGTLVTPAVLGLAAAAGVDRLTVHRRPTVELLVLGDELLTEGPPRDGRIRDALGPMLPGWLAAYGATVTGVRRVGDDRAALVAALRASRADVVVTTGATASGPADFLHPALADLGATLLVDGVRVRPGHPMLLAVLPSAEAGAVANGAAANEAAPNAAARHLVGLPGNPFAAAVGAATLAEPLLRGLGGSPAAEPYRVPAGVAFPGQPGHTRLVPVALPERGAVPLRYDGPAMLRGLALAEGLAVVPPGGVAAGAPVEVLDVPCG
ncbi:molybdopterin molybdotransferase MoeA [Streptacidiphilus jiangxiensis]|uniref:Molybdopterin molybdenumtransferase n=1 Tax=Streptacidiphilus jiangxiensis TaxID=235985 RepID=A0A1H7JH09_STRJI|nr:molybdopterin molybdotransferase MoeA [Streptacidiphilus jiangxiensis]SEK73921.1 molybdopterin molybdotransferase [Streptacidiphilus jiangxiensis]